jgi:hypothetical protein
MMQHSAGLAMPHHASQPRFGLIPLLLAFIQLFFGNNLAVIWDSALFLKRLFSATNLAVIWNGTLSLK